MWTDIMEEVDKNKDGIISWKEFKCAMNNVLKVKLSKLHSHWDLIHRHINKIFASLCIHTFLNPCKITLIHMRNVDAWKPKKFRPPINFYFLENTEGIWSNEIFRISKKIKSAIFQWFIFSIGFFSSKMNAVCRDLFKNVKIWGVRSIFCPKNGFLIFKFDEDWRCQKNSDH